MSLSFFMRSTPVVDGPRVFVQGPEGGLYCLETETGRQLWHVDTFRQFHVVKNFFGVGSTPIVEGDFVLVNVGGRENSGIAAFSLQTGQTVWKVTQEGASYSSPVATTIDSVRHVIFVTRLSVLSLRQQR